MNLPGKPSLYFLKVQQFILGNSYGGKRIPGLDILRSLAILFVLLSHALRYYISPVFIPQKTIHAAIALCGYLGVEIFFVLSGFLIGKIIIDIYRQSPEFNFKVIKGFWIRRWFRTLPNYLLVLIIYLVIDTVNGAPHRSSYIFYFLFTQNLITMPHYMLFDVSWSLSIEEWFYLLLPITLVLFSLIFSRQKKQAVIATILFFLITSFIVRYFYLWLFPNADWTDIRKVVVCRLDSLMYGVGAALVYRYKSAWWKKNPVVPFATGLSLIIIMSVVLIKYLSGTVYPNALLNASFFPLVSLSIAFIFPFMTIIEIRNRWVNLFFNWVSLISYSLYLIHQLIIMLTLKIIGQPESPTKAVGLFLLFFVAAFTVATFQYHFFEKPLTNLREKFDK